MSTTNAKHAPGGQDDLRSATAIDSLPERARLQLRAVYDECTALRNAVSDREAGIRNVKRGWEDCAAQLARVTAERDQCAEALRGIVSAHDTHGLLADGPGALLPEAVVALEAARAALRACENGGAK